MPDSSCPALLWCHSGLSAFRLREFYPLRRSFPALFDYASSSFFCGPQPLLFSEGLASFPFARRYLENRCFFLFLRVLRCFSSPGFPLYDYVFIIGYLPIKAGEFPHSDICGSMDICSSPQLIAACHVLLRLPVPRHSPYALSHLTILLPDLA